MVRQAMVNCDGGGQVLENLGFRLVRARGRDESLFFVQVSAEQALLEQVRILELTRFQFSN